MKKFIIALSMLIVSIAPSHAFPDKTMTIVVPYSAGGVADNVARVAGKYVADKTNQSVIVNNKPGGATIIGSQEVLSKPADGYTSFIVAASFVINPHLMKLPFDIEKDFQPVSLLTTNPHVFVINNNIPANNLAEFIEWSKNQKQEPTYSSFGNGSSGHIGTEILKDLIKIDMLHVPYKGGAPSTLAVVTGEVDATLADIGSIFSHVKSNKVKAIAVTGDERSALLPDVPTFKEEGIEEFKSQTWLGLWVRKGTPNDRVEILNNLFNEAMQADEIKTLLSQQGLQVRETTPEEFSEFVKIESNRYKKAIEEADISIE